MRDQLIAYIEGTLSPTERRDVLQHLQNSAAWQAEWREVQQVQSRLADRCSWREFADTPTLDNLLPDILDKAARPTPRYHYWMKGLEVIGLMTVLFGALLMVPLVFGDSKASAQNGWSPNNPVSTNTLTSTPADAPQFAALQETQEPELNSMRVIVVEFALGASTHPVATMSFCEVRTSGGATHKVVSNR